MVFALDNRGKADVTACLAGDLVAVLAKKSRKFFAAEFSGEFHIAITSSLTICRRTMGGTSLGSK